MKSSVTVLAPATSANLGSGFDVFGVALDCLHDLVRVSISPSKGVRLRVSGLGSSSIPLDPVRNTAGIVARELLSLAGTGSGLEVSIRKGVEPGWGLGSSAASAAATAVALNELLELGLSPLELVAAAAKGEVASAGAPHADNVAPSILGNFTIVRSYDPLDVVRLTCPRKVEFVVFMPDIKKKDTATMRAVLPAKLDLSQLVYNVGRAATFAAGVALGDIDLMGKGMSDAVVEGARARLYPGLLQAKEEIISSGAKGVALSGAGPSLIALVATRKQELDVSRTGVDAFERQGILCRALSTRPALGAQVVKSEGP